MWYNPRGDKMDRKNIEKIAQNPEDKLLLAKAWDKIQAGMRKNIPANTCFLSPREQELTRYLFGDEPGLCYFGGHKDAERKMLCWLPEYWDESYYYTEDSPLVCLQAAFWNGDAPSHRDFLGALMGAGIAREAVGDICVSKGSAFLFVTAEMAPYVLQNFTNAGRTALHLEPIPLSQLEIAPPETKQIKDTVASLRLDSILASGFRISRSLAAEYIAAGRAAIDGLPCEKPDKAVTEGMKLSLRGLGKIRLTSVGNQTKKGRILVVIDRYI